MTHTTIVVRNLNNMVVVGLDDDDLITVSLPQRVIKMDDVGEIF